MMDTYLVSIERILKFTEKDHNVLLFVLRRS